ncbi:(S)-benzoin forming benzil reductase [Bacillaceae bacterium S4-13-56]
MELAIITGASRGLGQAIAEQMLEKGIHVYGVSRQENKSLKEKAENHEVNYQHFLCDLSSTSSVDELNKHLIKNIKETEPSKIYLIQNAGVVNPIETVGNMESEEIVNHVHVNLIAPMIIANTFLKELPQTEMVIVNVTSGAAQRSVHGWSVYGSTKAAIDRFTETTGLEQDQKQTGNQVLAFSPGIIDTDMQGDIRSSTEEAFQDVEKFKEYKEKGLLRTPTTVAGALMNLLFNHSFENGKVYRVDNFL